MTPQKRKKNKAKETVRKTLDPAAKKQLKRQLISLIAAVVLWLGTLAVMHLPQFQDKIAAFFVNFTLQSTLLFGKLFFLPVKEIGFPFISVDNYTMEVVMECTAYNFYVFIFYLSIFSPVNWKQRLVTLLIFIGAVFVMNILRFIILGYIGNISPDLFHFLHDYLWNILFGFMVFLIWVWRYNRTNIIQR